MQGIIKTYSHSAIWIFRRSLILSLTIFLQCKDMDDGILESKDHTPTAVHLDFGHLPSPNFPEDNPLTEEGVLLGRMLFYDPLLSKDSTISCSSCHHQHHAFSDHHRFSKGVDGSIGSRNSMALFNLARHENGFFWDGRASTLREQVLIPIQSEAEMDQSLESVVFKLGQSKMYQEHFRAAFGTEDVTVEKLALALEQFLLNIISQDSKFDRFVQGRTVLSESEERGRVLYFRRFDPLDASRSGAHCIHCHSEANLDNGKFMNIGLDADGSLTDPGRGGITHDPGDVGKFKVPSLRNIAVSAPYMHDGRFQTLEEVLGFYNQGIHGAANLESSLIPAANTGLALSNQDLKDIIAFLHTLTDPGFLQNESYGSPFKN